MLAYATIVFDIGSFMGVVVLIFSLIALFTVTGGPAKLGLHSPVDTSRFIVSRPIVAPPARKSVIVDTDGYAHRTADGTQMTKRDRTKFLPSPPRTFEYKLPEKEPAPEVTLDVVTQPETKTVEDLSVPMMPAEPVEQPVDPTAGQKAVRSILDADPDLSEWARTTLRGSVREGLLILYGVVKDEKEKTRVAQLAGNLPGVHSVENQLHTLDMQAEDESNL